MKLLFVVPPLGGIDPVNFRLKPLLQSFCRPNKNRNLKNPSPEPVIQIEVLMRFRLSTLILLVAIVAIILGWIADRRNLVSHLGRQSLETLSIESAVAKGSLGNTFVQKHIDVVKGDITEKQFATFKDELLVENIVVLDMHGTFARVHARRL